MNVFSDPYLKKKVLQGVKEAWHFAWLEVHIFMHCVKQTGGVGSGMKPQLITDAMIMCWLDGTIICSRLN